MGGVCHTAHLWLWIGLGTRNSHQRATLVATWSRITNSKAARNELVAALILKRPALDAGEVRYLRTMVGDTQAEFAKRLEVERATVNRWENSMVPISGTSAYAIRAHVFFRLRGKSTAVDAVAEAFLQTRSPEKRGKRPAYRIDAADLVAA